MSSNPSAMSSSVPPKNTGFSFKQFAVRHDRCAMKVGTDGVLVGAWARGGRRMLDIGSGTGLVSLMLAQRFPESTVEGLEIDATAVAQSRENVTASPFAQRITIFETSFRHFTPSAPYDAIVSNPPYFLDSVKNADDMRTLARHSNTSFFQDFFRFCKFWLAEDGEVSLVIPLEASEAISAEAYLLGFLLSRKVLVRSVPSKPVERCLVSFVRKRTVPVELDEVCLMGTDSKRSVWYEEISRDFYLH